MIWAAFHGVENLRQLKRMKEKMCQLLSLPVKHILRLMSLTANETHAEPLSGDYLRIE